MQHSDLRDAIIDTLRKNRISSVEVADALGKKGVITGVHSINTGHYIAGIVQYISTWELSNWPLHEQAEHAKEKHILFIDAIRCQDRACFGDLVAKYLLLYKGALGIVTNGYVRDAHQLIKENWPIWASGKTPLGCFNRPVELTESIAKEIEANSAYYDQGILICDDSGCTLIEPNDITEETLKKLEFIELQEDIWFYCIDTLKWSTYETVCLKKYLDRVDDLPQGLSERLRAFGDL